MKAISGSNFYPKNYSVKLDTIKNKLDDCVRYIQKEKPRSSNLKTIACLVILEEDLQALNEELEIFTGGFFSDSNLVDAFLERCATVIEEVVSLQDSQERSMVIRPFTIKIKNYYHHSPGH